MKILKLSMLCLVLGLAGCSDSKRVVDLHLSYITAHSAPVNSSDANAQAQVAIAATTSSGALEEISAIDAASNPTSPVQKPWDAHAIGMDQLASIDWNGPVKPILEKIADASAYHVRVIGIEPPIPVLVIVNANNQQVADILRNVMYQVHTKADIKVYPKTKTLELRYYPS